MSMREYPTSGYVVEASKFTDLLPEDQRAAYQEALDDQDTESAKNILAEHLPENFPCFSDVYRPAEEDTVDEPMETGGMYVVFDEEDMYVRTPTPGRIALLDAGLMPDLQHWSVWG